MIATGHANFFSIVECGLYRHGESSAVGCDISETFDLIQGWVADKSLTATIPWDPKHRNGAPKCYCRDIYKCEESGEYVLVLWKSDTDGAGTLWGAPENAQTGHGKIVEYTNKHKGEKVVWGRPCYYWVVPSLRTVVSIKFDHSVCDSAMMQDWVTRVITDRAHHANKKREETASGQVRLSFTDGTEDKLKRFAYRFDVRLLALDSSSAELTDLSSRVTHVVRRETIQLKTDADDRSAWVKIFDKIQYLSPKPKAKSRQIEVKAEAKPTAEEIKKIIEEFAKENRKRSEWNNVGFETDKGTFWVDKYRLHAHLNINQEKPGVLPAAALHQRLTERRAELLGPIIRESTNGKSRAA